MATGGPQKRVAAKCRAVLHYFADSRASPGVWATVTAAVVSVAGGPLVKRDEAQSCPSRALATKPGWRFTSGRKGRGWGLFTIIFNEVFLIGSTQSVKRSEPKSCVFLSSSPSLLRRRQPLMRSAFPALKLCGLRIPGHTRCGGCGYQGTLARSAGTQQAR